MGQYHVLVNVDKQEIVHPHELGLGLKQWEHAGGVRGSISDALYILTMTSPSRGGGDFNWTAVSGRWVGDRVMVVGDYTENDDIPESVEITFNGNRVYGSQLYWHVGEHYTDISPQVALAIETVFGIRIEGDGWKDRVDVEAVA